MLRSHRVGRLPDHLPAHVLRDLGLHEHALPTEESAQAAWRLQRDLWRLR
jgi:hypothetical protein